MEIIKEGKLNTVKWSREVTCTGNGNPCTDGCGAILKVVPDDLRFYDGNSGYFERDSAVVMRCPCCGGITDLMKEDWPTKAYQLKKFSMAWKNDNE